MVISSPQCSSVLHLCSSSPFLGCAAQVEMGRTGTPSRQPHPYPSLPARSANVLRDCPFQDQPLAVARAALVTDSRIHRCLPARIPNNFPPSQRTAPFQHRATAPVPPPTSRSTSQSLPCETLQNLAKKRCATDHFPFHNFAHSLYTNLSHSL
jgi:hypothetical protein